MRSVRGISLIPLLLGLATAVAGPAGAQVKPGETFTGTVTGAVDGDTFEIWRSAGDTVTVDLWGVDAPEPGQTYGAATTRAVRSFATNKSVWVSVKTLGLRGRARARIEVRGKDLSEVLVRRGLVWHADRQAPTENTLKRLEREARAEGRGLWSQPTPIPPWEWRERKGETQKLDGKSRGADPSPRRRPSERTLPSRRTRPPENVSSGSCLMSLETNDRRCSDVFVPRS